MGAVDLSVIFRSRTQYQILSLLYLNPDTEYPLPEIVRRTGLPQPTVSREIARMSSEETVISRKSEGRRFARANTLMPIYVELVGLLRYQKAQDEESE